MKDQLTAITESLESKNKDEVKIICAAKNEVIEMMKTQLKHLLTKQLTILKFANTGKPFSKIFVL